ncbi:hypothetical protein APP86_04720 [Salmonella enterica subsp. houtenae]|nr:hypothetical protein APP86_04720 [Salmonella enterica subsp. houtenae]
MIKDLVASGHALADDMTGAPSVLVRCLAAQLEVQLVRANALAAENAGLKAAHPQPFGLEMMKALDAYDKCQDEVPENGMLDAFFILRDSIRVETPATDALLAEVRASELDSLAGVAETMLVKFANQGASEILEAKGWEAVRSQASHRAAQLRKGAVL